MISDMEWQDTTPVVDPWSPDEISAIIEAEERQNNPFAELARYSNELRKKSERAAAAADSWAKSIDHLMEVLTKALT